RASADACRRMIDGIGTSGSRPSSPEAEPNEILRCLRTGRSELWTAMKDVTSKSLGNVFPLYFITLPGPFGLHLVALEIGTHRNDLTWALDGEEALPHDIIDVAAVMVP